MAKINGTTIDDGIARLLKPALDSRYCGQVNDYGGGYYVTDGKEFLNPDEALVYARELWAAGDGVVLKSRERGRVRLNIRDRESFCSAFAEIRGQGEGDCAVLTERYRSGASLRLTVINTGRRCVCAYAHTRVPPHVIGNGKDSVEQLARDSGQTISATPESLFLEQCFKPGDIPPADFPVMLTGRTQSDVPKKNVAVTNVHEVYKAAAVRAVSALPEAETAEVTIITGDWTVPAEYAIIDVDIALDFNAVFRPDFGKPFSLTKFIDDTVKSSF